MRGKNTKFKIIFLGLILVFLFVGGISRGQAEKPPSPEGLYQTAYDEYKKGNYEQAISGFRTYLSLFPMGNKPPDARYLLGWIYFIQGNYLQAIEEFRAVVRDYPKSEKAPLAMWNMGDAYLELGEKVQARSVFQNLLAMYPDSTEAISAKGMLGEFAFEEADKYEEAGQKDMAIGAIREAIRIEERQPQRFMDYAQSWIRTYASVRCKPSTVQEYQSVIRNHLAPAFGNLALSDITREAIKRFIAEKTEGGLSRSTVSWILAPFTEMLNHAVDDGILTSNPAARAGRFNRARTEKEAKRFDCLTREELAHLLQAAKEHCPSYYPFILCAARTGMRWGELVGMQWGDVDFHNRFIEVRRSVRKGRVSSPKAGKIRRVDMSAQLTEVLKGLRDIRLAEAAVKGIDLGSSAWVFCNQDGSLLDSGNFYSRSGSHSSERWD